MTLFELVKQKISVSDAAEHYGLQVSRNGMACCPFHDDWHPSMKLNERYFYCFGCGATGDVIDLVAKLFGLSSYEAAKKLAHDFGIDPDKPPAAIALPRPKRPLLKAYRQEEVRCLRVLCDYLHLLESWKVQHAPSNPNKTGAPNGTQQSGSVGERTNSGMNELSPQGGSEGYAACEDEDDRFVEACQMLDYVECLADLLIAAEIEQRVKIVDILNKDGLIAGLEGRLKRLEKEEVTHEEKQAA